MRHSLRVLDDLLTPHLDPYNSEEIARLGLLLKTPTDEILAEEDNWLTTEETSTILSWLPAKNEDLVRGLEEAVIELLTAKLQNPSLVLEKALQSEKETLFPLLAELAGTPRLGFLLTEDEQETWCWRGRPPSTLPATLSDSQALILLGTINVASREQHWQWQPVWEALQSSNRYRMPTVNRLTPVEVRKLWLVHSLTVEQSDTHKLIPARHPRISLHPHIGSPEVQTATRLLLTDQQKYTDLGTQVRLWAETAKGKKMGRMESLHVERAMKKTWKVAPFYNQFILTGAKGTPRSCVSDLRAGAEIHEGRELTVYSIENNDVRPVENLIEAEASFHWGDSRPHIQPDWQNIWSGLFTLPSTGSLYLVTPVQGRKPNAAVPVPKGLAGETVWLEVFSDQQKGWGSEFLFWFRKEPPSDGSG